MRLYLVGALAAFLMAGCGGSSGPNDSDNKEKTTSLKGVAVDDLIVNGVVRAYSASDSTELAKGRTDKNDGSYSLNVSYDGVVIIEVTCDNDSLMKNPLTNKTKKCIADLKLHSAATVAPEKKEIKVNISPVSELVVRQMKERGSATKENLEAAQENIGEMFSFDPLGESPVENPQYSKVISAIHEMADAKADTTILDIIDELNEDYKDGKAGDDESVISENFAKAMVKVGANNKLTKNDGAYIPIVKQEEDRKKLEDEAKKKAEENKKKLEEAKKKANEEEKKKLEEAAEKKRLAEEAEKKRLEEIQKKKDDITLSKQFFNDLRTQAMSVIDYKNSETPGFLDNEAKSIATALENVTMNSETAGRYTVGLVTDILDLAEKQSDGDTKNSVDDDTSIVYTKDSVLVWSYSILEANEEKYKGTVTLPSENPKEISLKTFTGTLSVKFDGTVPLEGDSFGGHEGHEDSSEAKHTSNKESRVLASDAQTLKADISLTKKSYGSDFVLNNVSLTSKGTTIALSALNLSAYYTFDDEGELVPNHLIFGGATLSGSTGVYSLNGKLEILEYVQNDSLKDNDFMEDRYETYVHAGAFCLDEHNQRIDLSDGIATYTDASDEEHQLTANRWGNFYANIEENVGNLNPDDYRYGNSRAQDPYYGDGNYSKFVGLKFDNITMASDSCSNIVLEHLDVEVIDGNTSVNGHIFCVDGESRREFDMQQDENGTSISEVTASFTDANDVSHPFDVWGGHINTQYEGNSENIALDRGRYREDRQQNNVIDFDAITIESDCINSQLDYIEISFEPDNNYNGEISLYTQINGSFSCTDNNTISDIPEATITYTDKSGTVHQSSNDNNHYEGLRYENGHFHGRIKGNVEALPINMGRKSYHAARFINTVESDDITITSSSCANPKLSYFNIGLDHNEDFFNSGYLPKKVTFDGNITNANAGAISGNVSIDWLNAKTMNLLKDSNDSPLVDVSVTGTIQMPESPEMLLNIGYKNSESEDNNFTFNYAYGATSITGTGDFDKKMKNGDVVLTSHQGLRANIKIVDGEVIYGAQSSVTRNGSAVGTFEERQGIPVIKYTDGTFESLP